MKKKAGGWHHTEEAKARIRAANLGKKRPPEACAKMGVSSRRFWAKVKQLQAAAEAQEQA